MKTYQYLNILMFPTTACNLRCKYCFHAQSEYKNNQMDINFIERVFEKLFPNYEYLQLIWHGGEPLCVGLDFYKQVIELETKYSKKYGTLIDNGVMTNGTLVTDEWASFFKTNKFDVGISFDGIHNEELRGKTKEVERALELLKKYDCDVDIVTVITNNNLYDQIENYEYIKTFGFEVKFNPVAKIGGGVENDACDLDSKAYVEQCIKLFDYWLYDNNNPVILNPYYSYLRDIVEKTSSGCQRTSCLGRWIALHPNGDIYPCVRETRKEYKFGNIFDVESMDNIWDSKAFLELLGTSIERRERCSNCGVYSYCHGGCPVNAITGNGKFACETFRNVFSYVLDSYDRLMHDIEKGLSCDSINPVVKSLIGDII